MDVIINGYTRPLSLFVSRYLIKEYYERHTHTLTMSFNDTKWMDDLLYSIMNNSKYLPDNNTENLFNNLIYKYKKLW